MAFVKLETPDLTSRCGLHTTLTNRTPSLPGSLETASAVLAAMESNDVLERPDDIRKSS